MEMPRAWSATAVERRLSLALLAGSLLKAIAAACAPLPRGPWDVKAVSLRLVDWRITGRFRQGILWPVLSKA
jgi:hypothetical protein